jgi:hypothetical protein
VQQISCRNSERPHAYQSGSVRRAAGWSECSSTSRLARLPGAMIGTADVRRQCCAGDRAL